MREFHEFVKVAKEKDPMKKGYIVGRTIKGALKGGLWGGGIGAGYSGIKMLKNLPDTPTKKNLIGLGVRTAIGAAVGGYGGASVAKSGAIDARIDANIPEEKRAKLDALAQQKESARKRLNKLVDIAYQNQEEIEDGYAVSTVSAKQQKAIRDAEKELDAARVQYAQADREARNKSKQDLLQRGLLKKAAEIRLSPSYTAKRVGQGAVLGGLIGGIGLGASTVSLKGLAAGASIGAGLGGTLGYHQGKSERRESFADPALKRKYEKALDSYREAHRDYENAVYRYLGDGVDCDGATLLLTKKERQELDNIRGVMNQRESDLGIAHKAYKESAKHNFKNRKK